MLLASCGDGDKSASTATAPPASAGTIELTVRSVNGAGARTYELTCRPGLQRVAGSRVNRDAVTVCFDARALAPLLIAKGPARRVCTQLYGGPQTARITGAIDGRTVNRTFKRTNGCEIADYARVAKILPR